MTLRLPGASLCLSGPALALLLGACAPSSPQPHVREDSPAPAPSPGAPDRAPARPEPQPVPPDSPSPTPPTAWWCACYARAGAPPTPATACRKDHVACQRLERKARRGGGNAILPGSLTHACREVRAEHPGDVLGGRDRWQPSDRPGNWLSLGACLLPGPPDAPTSPSELDTEGPPSILASEHLGDLEIGLAAPDILKLLGPPARRSGAKMSEATGSYTQTWEYPAQGLELALDAAVEKGPYTLAGLTATAPCALRTARGVGIGDTYRAVKTAYMKERDPEVEPDDLSFVAGSIYSGVIFTFDPETKLVTQIFFGAAAE